MICHMFGAKSLPKVPLPSNEPLRINLIKIWKKKNHPFKKIYSNVCRPIFWGGNILNHQNAINLTDQYTINLMNANDIIMRLMTISLTSHDTVGGLFDSTCEQWPVDSPDRTAMPFMRFLLLAWTSGWRNNPGACDLRPHDAHVTPL